MLIFLGFSILAFAGIIWFLQQPVFGRSPHEKNRLQRIRRSEAFVNGKFQYPVPTPMRPEGVSNLDILKQVLLEKSPNTSPPAALPVVKQDLYSLSKEGPFRVIWFGHSSYLLIINGLRIWVDPVFSERISPVSFFGSKRFEGTGVYSPEDLPEGDLVVLTHDHYDHLDYGTIKHWKDQPGAKGEMKFLTSLGVGETLERWDISPGRITELDWWEEVSLFEGIKFTAVPARHFSGRSYSRDHTLWSGFVLETEGQRILIGGDSGYGPHYKEIGNRFGDFDVAFLECGQYNEMWPLIHMMPEETVRAAQDLNARTLFPVHWGKFVLAIHAWDEPIRRVTSEAERLGVPLITPKIGEMVIPGDGKAYEHWWEKVK